MKTIQAHLTRGRIRVQVPKSRERKKNIVRGKNQHILLTRL